MNFSIVFENLRRFSLRAIRGRTTRSAYVAELLEGLPPLAFGLGLFSVQASLLEVSLLFWLLGSLGVLTGLPFFVRAVARRLHDSGRSLRWSAVLLPAVLLWGVLQALSAVLLGVPGQLAAALSWTVSGGALLCFLGWVGWLAPTTGLNRYGRLSDDYSADGTFML